MLPYEQKRGKCYKTNSVSIGIIKCFAASTVTTRARKLSFGNDNDTAPQSTAGESA